MNERDVTTLWRKLFQGQTMITPALITEAEVLIGHLSSESPLRIRLAKELDDVRKLQKRR